MATGPRRSSTANSKIQTRTVVGEVVALEGGLDLINPPLKLKSGVARESLNFEPDLEAGYSRTGGYDVYAGGKTPADRRYYKMAISLVHTGRYLHANAKLTGMTSGATAWLVGPVSGDYGYLAGTLQPSVLEPGLYQEVYVADVAGAFIQGEAIRAAGYQPIGDGPHYAVPMLFEAAVSEIPWEVTGEDNRSHALAVNEARAAMRRVMRDPGNEYVYDRNRSAEGPVLCLVDTAPDKVCAIKKRVGSNDVNLYIAAPNELSGLAPDVDVVRWQLYNRVGRTNQNMALGRYEHARWAFTFFPNPTNQPREHEPIPKDIFITSGKGPCLWLKPALAPYGMLVTEVITGTPGEAPSHCCCYRSRLVLAFGSSFIVSVEGEPSIFDAVLGSFEWNVGDEITGFQVVTGSENNSALLIQCRTSTHVLYGNDATDWQVVPYSPVSGALPGTIQHLSSAVFNNEKGITNLAATQAWGSFAEQDLARTILPILNHYRGRAVASVVSRSRGQYRLHFDDGFGVVVGLRGNKSIGAMPIRYAHTPRCFLNFIDASNEEVLLMGTEDGQVMRLNSGPSFAGEPVQAYLFLAFNNIGMPWMRKKFYRAALEIQFNGFAEFDVGYDINYATTQDDVTPDESFEVPGVMRGAQWDDFVWDEFTWDGLDTVPVPIDAKGDGQNISLRIKSYSAITNEFTPTAAAIDWARSRVARTSL